MALFSDKGRVINLVTIAESVASSTVLLANTVSDSSWYIQSDRLGVMHDEWNEDDIHEIIKNNTHYANNCINYREKLSNTYLASKMIWILAERTI